ncbi:MAG: AMP-binding protein [Desulfovibrio sp.]|jgi:4-coumarate--CoA ligase (photoactive yellow protein activation family)|nr:AMP-binding protein [Desulfovibrio sp.]
MVKMKEICLERKDILRILHDMTLAHIRQFFLQTDCLNLPALPAAHRQSTAKNALEFFNLDVDLLAFLEQAETLEQRTDIIYGAFRRNSSFSVTFRTSGSTGTPNACTLSAEELEEEAESLALFFPSMQRVVAIAPLHHVYGFVFALMLPKLLDIPVVHLHPLTTAEFFKMLRPGDMLLAFPLFWASVLKMTQYGLKPPVSGMLRGVTSGAPCDPRIIEGLLGAAENSPQPFLSEMTEIYGATEFGAVGMRRDCRKSYALLPHWRRVQIGVDAKDGGEAMNWGIHRATGNALPLPDILYWQDERRFVPVRRKDKAVQVGSTNVFPTRIADIVRAHPQVRDCSVRLMRPEEGNRLKAFVVPAEDNCVVNERAERHLRRTLKTWLAARLDPAEIPKSIVFGASLPVTSSGKATDWVIPQQN